MLTLGQAMPRSRLWYLSRHSKINDWAVSIRGGLHRKFKLEYVSISLRESISATVNNWSGALYDGKKFHTSRKYIIDHIVDRVGGGDAYLSGIIYCLLTGQDIQESVEFAAAASCNRHRDQAPIVGPAQIDAAGYGVKIAALNQIQHQLRMPAPQFVPLGPFPPAFQEFAGGLAAVDE